MVERKKNKEKGRKGVVNHKLLVQAIPIGEENCVASRDLRLKFNYPYSTLSTTLSRLSASGTIKRKRDEYRLNYLYWREPEENKKLYKDKATEDNQMGREERLGQLIKEEIKSREEYDMFAKALLSPDVQKLFLQKLTERGDDLSWFLRMIPELQIALNTGYAKEWIESHLSNSFEIFDKIYQEAMEEVETETEKETEIKHPEKHDLVALKEEVGKLEGRIAELEEESEYFQVSQKKNELEERATALEKQLKKMQEEEWKVREDMK